MATEFPQPQMEPQAGPEDTEGIVFDLEDEFAEVEEQPDGSAIVRMEDFKGPNEDQDFYQNLAEEIPSYELSALALKYLDLIEKDKDARKERDKQYEEGLKRTGMGNDAPGGAQFQGASRVVHPAMAEACIDFESRAIKELFPPDGPVRTNIIGKVDEEQERRAERKRDFMNWQLTEQIEEFRDEEEQMLTQLPLGGSQYLKMYYDSRKKRPVAEFIPIDNVILPFSAANFYTAQRATEMQDITQQEFESRIASGLYRDVSIVRASMEPEPTAPEKANDKIEGREDTSYNEDGLRTIFEIYTHLDFGDGMEPYIISIDKSTRKALALYRNWEPEDDRRKELDWIVEFPFVPWRGAYPIGLTHMIGGLSGAATGALRALLDSAHIQNVPTLLKLKGGPNGQTINVQPTEVAEIEGGALVDDIRKLAMPLPFNGPSPTLYQLLGFLVDAGKGVVQTSFEKLSDQNPNAPVGTTLALIEQGMVVFSSIHMRLHNSMERVFRILHRINSAYLTEEDIEAMENGLDVKPEDFDGPMDVVPVSDPHIFSETQRIAQMQAVMQMAKEYPQIFDQRAVVSRMLKQLKVPNINELMPNALKPAEMNAADENSAMALGRPAFAYPRQDHLAHLQAHLNFALDPTLGSNPLVAQRYIPQVLEHIKQHMMLWYTSQMSAYVQGGTDVQFQKYEDSKLVKEIDKAVALASDHVKMDTQQVFSGVVPALQQLQQMMMQMQKAMQQQPPMDGEAQAVLQASLAETQRRQARDQADLQIATARLQADQQGKEQDRQVKIAMNAENNLTQERIKTAELTVDEAKLQKEQSETAIQLNQATQRNLGG